MQSKSCHIASSDERCSGQQLWHFKTKTYLMVFIYLDRPMQKFTSVVSCEYKSSAKTSWETSVKSQHQFSNKIFELVWEIMNSLRPPPFQKLVNEKLFSNSFSSFFSLPLPSSTSQDSYHFSAAKRIFLCMSSSLVPTPATQ